jgi:pimeloyl-ACP methyl ester carboxylesterase
MIERAASMADNRSQFEEITFTTRDGLRLYGRRYPAPATGRRPVLCLAGLTRNSRDFHRLALYLSQHRKAPRTVYTMDYRGRGRSDHDPDWRNYALPIEMLDVIDFMTVVSLHDAAVVGTSRGGLIATLMAAAQPSTIGALVLNDIGPVIETDGLMRIAGYVGRMPLPGSWEAATQMVRDLNKRQFPAVADAEWADFARQLFNDHNGRPAPGYDAKLAHSLSVLDGPMPALWPQFTALTRVPVLVLRGEHSDILSAATVEEMARRHPMLVSHVVPGQGHAPLLMDADTLTRVAEFLEHADGTSLVRPRAVA